MFEKLDPADLYDRPQKAGEKLIHFLCEDIQDSQYVLFGYPDDQGILNNGGQPGASLAPNEIRKHLYKMTPPPFLKTPYPKLYDFGNQKPNGDLADRHQEAASFVQLALDNNMTTIGLGGGHDFGYVDGKAFLNFCSDGTQKPLIINFDAHLDVRPLEDKITSGTPFYRLLEDDQFEFLEIGIQNQCNSKEHIEYVQNKGGHILYLDQLLQDGELKLEPYLEFFKNLNLERRPCFLSVDMDVFSNAYAPGCSQVFSTGLTPFLFQSMLKFIVENFYVRSLGIYEASPPLDHNSKTSQLAAQIIYWLIQFKEEQKNRE